MDSAKDIEGDLSGQRGPAFLLYKTTKAQEKVVEVFIDAFAGATGGVLAALLFYPLENLRTRLQAGKINDSKDTPPEITDK